METNSAVAWKVGLWYWNTQTGPGSMTPHDAIAGGPGFGETIRSINGALECGGASPGRMGRSGHWSTSRSRRNTAVVTVPCTGALLSLDRASAVSCLPQGVDGGVPGPGPVGKPVSSRPR